MYKTNSQGGIYAPGKPISNEVRSKISDLFVQGLSYSEIAGEVRVDVKTCKKIISKNITDSISPGRSTGRTKIVSNLDTVEFIEYSKSIQPSITAQEIQQELLNLGTEPVPALSTINRIIRDKLGYTYKKLQVIPAESEREDVKQRIFEYMAIMSNTDPTTLHFFDESSVVRTSGNRLYGHSARVTPAYELQCYASDATFTVNLLHSMFGVDHFSILRGASNQLELINFIEECTQQRDLHGNPKIKRGDKIVMDNCGMHHGRLANEMLQDLARLHGFSVLFQPPYSPDLNTCEYCFRVMKCSSQKCSQNWRYP
ncbi:Paired box pox-meso [Paramuricea clavata]|uniref:Paired box pox-meso n=1 Tax=Paramuricea clavata TaxID=317549 RepID=A0A6S7FS04_PARCT|nr:Paired box pox-meso [Paramuricea clavata]